MVVGITISPSLHPIMYGTNGSEEGKTKYKEEGML